MNMVVVDLPENVYKALVEVARRRDVPVEIVIVDLVSEKIDPGEKTKLYLDMYEKLYSDFRNLYAKGDLQQAGEKLWGAVVSLINAYASLRGLPHYTHRDLWVAVERIVEETKDPEYSVLFGSAERLHANFYHNFMTKQSFDKHVEGVQRLIEKLKTLLSLSKANTTKS